MPDSPIINDSEDFIPMMPVPDSIIKQDSADDSGLSPIPFQFSDIQAMAAQILKKAQVRADQMLSNARSQVAAMEKQAQDRAYKDGFPKGEKAGFVKGETEGRALAKGEVAKAVEEERAVFRKNSEPAIKALDEVLKAVREVRARLSSQAEADLLLLSMDVAKRLVAHELSFDRKSILPLTLEAIGLAVDRSSLVIRINPEDMAVLEAEKPELAAVFPDLGPIRLEANPEVARGGVVVYNRTMEVDMRLAVRLAALEDAILGVSGDDAEAPWSRVSGEAGPLPPPQREEMLGDNGSKVEPEPDIPAPSDEPPPEADTPAPDAPPPPEADTPAPDEIPSPSMPAENHPPTESAIPVTEVLTPS